MTMLASMQDTQGKVKAAELAAHDSQQELKDFRRKFDDSQREANAATLERKRLEGMILGQH